ncbi:hypothetical protein SAMN05192562_101473 [Kosakonia arachidis]|uniref:Uncharacterized protein n=1 Tax=Kosakonia arachidis TaxID=551989 RepID=A0A1I6YDT7_9ENTR|nr:hypothetical protein SAMN05192562_101473 [Kosakonia arachidis]
MGILSFSLIGGVWLLWLLGYNLSVAGAVGFIALARIAAEFGVIMVLFLTTRWIKIVNAIRRKEIRCCYGQFMRGRVVHAVKGDDCRDHYGGIVAHHVWQLLWI